MKSSATTMPMSIISMVIGFKGANSMQMRTIEALTREWRHITWRAIELHNVPISRMRRLLLETYTALHALREKKSVSKSVCALLCEMQEFSWRIANLEQSPIYGLYPIYVTIIDAIRKEFLTGESDTKAIAQFLNGDQKKCNAPSS